MNGGMGKRKGRGRTERVKGQVRGGETGKGRRERIGKGEKMKGEGRGGQRGRHLNGSRYSVGHAGQIDA